MASPNSAGKLAFETERVLIAGGIGAGYTLMGTLFTQPIRILVLQNQTDAGVTFSLDGDRDTITLQAKTMFSLDIATNRSYQSLLTGPMTMGPWVKRAEGVVPTVGAVYVSAFYAAE